MERGDMKYTLNYQLNRGGHVSDVSDVLERAHQVREELSGFCQGDISYNPLEHVAVDLAVVLEAEDVEVAECFSLCYEEGPEETCLLALEMREHGKGMDLADVHDMLECFAFRLEQFVALGIDLPEGPEDNMFELALDITMVTCEENLARKFGFHPASK
jgi:hypothetical protein